MSAKSIFLVTDINYMCNFKTLPICHFLDEKPLRSLNESKLAIYFRKSLKTIAIMSNRKALSVLVRKKFATLFFTWLSEP